MRLEAANTGKFWAFIYLFSESLGLCKNYYYGRHKLVKLSHTCSAQGENSALRQKMAEFSFFFLPNF